MKNLKITALVLAILMLFTVCTLGSGSDAETSSKGEGESKEKTTEATASLPEYKVNELVSIKTSSGEYTVKITGVTETSERNEFADTKADRVILIAYEYENISYENDLSVDEMNMKAYDKDNNLLEDYPATEQKYGSAVGTGRKSNGVIAYALNNENNYIEIDFYDNMFNSKADCRFVLEW
ncbi:MAG: DUF5067 domain-containing protein [Ruminococcaceae bacterium]|nr:DUF5067 domain-containing protein [Oscillospiraceae bacterium]